MCDGDAVGSSLAWAEVLRTMGHAVTCVVPNKYPYFLDWMPGIGQVVVFKNDTAGDAVRAIAEADLLFCLDFNAVSRLEILSDTIEANTTARRVLIDHHLSPDGHFDLSFSYPDSSSTCFLVYSIIEALFGTDAITRQMAEALYVGIMTDTGNFAYSFLTPELFRAVAVLVEKGISIPEIHNNVYNAYTEGRARLFGYVINRKMEIIQDGTVAYMSLMENEMRRFQFQQGDSECSQFPLIFLIILCHFILFGITSVHLILMISQHIINRILPDKLFQKKCRRFHSLTIIPHDQIPCNKDPIRSVFINRLNKSFIIRTKLHTVKIRQYCKSDSSGILYFI